MSLREKENKLFEKWSKDRVRFAKDGAGKNFAHQKVKLIFIGKETNNTGNTFDWREYLDNGVFYKNTNKPFETSYNLYRWAKFLLDGEMDFSEYKKIERNKNKRVDVFSRIAFINIKKETGGSSANCNTIIETGRKDKEYLKQQLELYTNNNDIKILFLLGDCIYTPIKEILGEKKDRQFLNDSRFIDIYDNNLFVVRFYHQNCRNKECSKKNIYQLIKKVYDIINKNDTIK